MNKKSYATLLYSTIGVLAVGLILIALNVVSGAFKTRVDLTKEKAYTLSNGTKAILKKLDTPVKLRFYFTQPEGASPEGVFLKAYAKRVEDLLAEYRQAGRGKIIVEKYDPQPDSDAEDSARLDGVEGENLSNGERLYMGLAVNMLDQKQAIPFLAPNRERLLEYDISRAISRVMTPEKPVVGVLSPLPVFGMPANPMMARMGQQGGQQPWAIVNEVKNDFTVKRLDMSLEAVDLDVKVLVIIHPRDITDKALYAIDQFIMRGGKVIAFLDPLPMMDSREQNPMLGNMPNNGSSMEKLIKAWGLSFDVSKTVADLNYKMQIGGRNGQPQDAPAVLSITQQGINADDHVTSQIDNVWLPYAGAFTGTPVEGLKMSVLLKSTKNSQLVDGFMANLAGENVLKDFKPSDTEYALAVRLTGKFRSAFPGGKPEEKKEDAAEKKDEKPAEKPTASGETLKETKEDTSVILVGDADMLFDSVALRQVQSPFGGVIQMAMNGNISLCQNAVELFTGDNNLITVRSRAVQTRPFELVKKMQSEAEANYRSKIKGLEDRVAETQQQLNELQQKKEKGQRFILSPEQQQAIENLRKKEAEVKVQLKDERKKLRHDIDSLTNRLKWFNIAAVPALVSASGLMLAFYKRKRTSAK